MSNLVPILPYAFITISFLAALPLFLELIFIAIVQVSFKFFDSSYYDPFSEILNSFAYDDVMTKLFGDDY